MRFSVLTGIDSVQTLLFLYRLRYRHCCQGPTITLPERPGQVNFDCGHVDICCIGPAGMYFFPLYFGKIAPTTHPSAQCREIAAFAVNRYQRLEDYNMYNPKGPKKQISIDYGSSDFTAMCRGVCGRCKFTEI